MTAVTGPGLRAEPKEPTASPPVGVGIAVNSRLCETVEQRQRPGCVVEMHHHGGRAGGWSSRAVLVGRSWKLSGHSRQGWGMPDEAVALGMHALSCHTQGASGRMERDRGRFRLHFSAVLEPWTWYVY